MKPLPHGICRKLPKSVPTCSPRCVEPLCFLVQRNPTIGLTGILERRYSLSKRKITKCKPLHLPFFSCTRFLHFPFPLLYELFLFLYFLFAFLSFPFLISFSHLFFFSFLFIFLFAFLFHFLFSFGHSLSHFDRMVKRRKLRRKVSSHFLNPNVWL